MPTFRSCALACIASLLCFQQFVLGKSYFMQIIKFSSVWTMWHNTAIITLTSFSQGTYANSNTKGMFVCLRPTELWFTRPRLERILFDFSYFTLGSFLHHGWLTSNEDYGHEDANLAYFVTYRPSVVVTSSHKGWSYYIVLCIWNLNAPSNLRCLNPSY
jgi:hypothetical protein